MAANGVEVLQVQMPLVLTARICLGLFFLPSALRKLTDQRHFIEATIDYGIVPESIARPIGKLLPWIELGVALALIAGVVLPVAATASALLLISFIVAVVINLRRGREIPCNCYGIAGTAKIGWGTLGRNGILLALALMVAALGPHLDVIHLWLIPWASERAALSSASAAILLVLLLAWSVVLIYLVEWGLDDFTHAWELRHRPRLNQHAQRAFGS